MEPRSPTTGGSIDVLTLQPRLLPTFETTFERPDHTSRETRSEPRDSIPNSQKNFLPEPCLAGKIVETELGLASVPAMAIGSSTEVLVSIVENQAGLRRNSFLNVNSNPIVKSHDGPSKGRKRSDPKKVEILLTPAELEMKSPDFEFGKSPSTEMTNPSNQSSPTDVPKDISLSSLNPDNFQVCDKDCKDDN